MSKTIKLREWCKENGIKIRYLARKAKISDELLRYYMDRPELPSDIERAIRGEIVALTRKLKQVPDGDVRYFK